MSEETRHATDQELLLLAQGELPAEREESLRAHMAQCGACERRYTEWSDLDELLTGLSRSQMPSDMRARVRQRVADRRSTEADFRPRA